MKTTYRCHDPLCGLRKPNNMLKYFYEPTPEDTAKSLGGRISTYCDNASCQPLPNAAPNFTIDFRVAKEYNHLIDEDYSKLSAELSPDGNILDLKKYNIDYEYNLLQIKDVVNNLVGKSLHYTIPNKEVALFLAGLCGHNVSRGSLPKAIATCVQYMMEKERPIMAIPEPPEESPTPVPRPQRQLNPISNPDLIDWDALFQK